MTLVMAYVILITAGISASAVLVEALVRRRGIATRWVWVSGICLTTVATAFAMVAPKPATVFEAPAVEMAVMEPGVAARPATTPAVSALLNSADLFLPLAWGMASVLLLMALGAGQQRYRRERARAKASRVGGHDVLLTEDVGPAVAGVRRPVVFVPRWVLALDEGSQQLLLSHELEHVRERDTWLLLFGAVSVAVTPWNPVVWWMVRRLRLAVEQDCDARVLARHPGIRRYADLLLTAASRHDLAARLLAAHFGEYTSDLVRRIEAMTNAKSLSWRRTGGAAVVAAALIAVACETPRPDPVAPLASEKELPASQERSAEFSAQLNRCSMASVSGCAISVIVKSSDGKELRRYEGEIPVAEVPNNAVQSVHVEHAKCGSAECSLVWLTLKPDASLEPVGLERKKAGAVEERVALTRDALVEDSAVQRVVDERSGKRQREVLAELTQLPVLVSGSYVERDSGRVGNGTGVVALPPKVLLRSGNPDQAQVVVRGNSRYVGTPLFIVDGVIMKGKLDDIDPEAIESIEVVKGAAARLAYGDRAQDGVIRITTKAGRRIPR